MRPIYVYIQEYVTDDGLKQYPIDFDRKTIPSLEGKENVVCYPCPDISSLVCLFAALMEYSVPNPDYFIKALMKESANE